MNIKRFIDWAKEGKRKIEAVYDGRSDHGPFVWCYDFDLGIGTFVEKDDDPPTKSQLMAEETKRLKERQKFYERKAI
jgi:hypothetical protein